MARCCSRAEITIGALSLVSQPSTSTWKAKTIAMAHQNCAFANTRVPDQRSSTTVARTARTASRVYSGIGGSPARRPGARGAQPGEHPPDRLVGEQPADRHHDEEDELLDRHAAGQLQAGDVGRVVAPVVVPD